MRTTCGTILAAAMAALSARGASDVRDFGTKGDGTTMDTSSIQSAIDKCGESGGGRVDVGSGFYPIGGIRLRSGVTLHLESGAILQASRDSADFDILGRDSVEPVDGEAYRLGRTRVWTPPRGKDERTASTDLAWRPSAPTSATSASSATRRCRRSRNDAA